MSGKPAKKRVAVLISGRGSNMSALIAASFEPQFPARIVQVLADKADAAGLEAARKQEIEAVAVPRADFEDKEAHEAAMIAALERAKPDIICLAGFMRILSAGFLGRFRGRVINIHPSLLPLFAGLHTHERALAAGMRVHGCSVHFVTEGVDDGPVIAQAVVPVAPEDDADSLAARVLKAEHALYPEGLRLVAEGRVRMDGVGRASFDSQTSTVTDYESILLSVD